MSNLALNTSPWVAIYVKHRHEKSVAQNLQGKGVTSFLPLYSQQHKNGKAFDLPFFPGYVFCRLDIKNSLAVRSTPGVFKIIENCNGPEEIPESEIDRIRQTLSSRLTVRPWPYISIGNEVYLNSGPLRGVRGVVVDDTHHQWLVLSVHLLKRSVAVKVERSQFTPDQWIDDEMREPIEPTKSWAISTAIPR